MEEYGAVHFGSLGYLGIWIAVSCLFFYKWTRKDGDSEPGGPASVLMEAGQ